MTIVAITLHFFGGKYVVIPWLVLPLVGTAVAFYVGFKNNQSYDRQWEARKIWSEITNDSRKFAGMIRYYQSGEPGVHSSETIRRTVAFRHIAFLYQMREQLLVPAPWEHVSLHNTWGVGNANRRRRSRLGEQFREELDAFHSRNYLSVEENDNLSVYSNKALQILNTQMEQIQMLLDNNQISMIQQMEIQTIVCNFYDSLGRLERIKQTPFPRKYATFSFLFVCIFIFLLPFGIIGELAKNRLEIWLSIPIGVIIGWVYLTMEMIGDYSENPFEGLHNDTPMLSICRAIEIEILEILGEVDLPEPVWPKKSILF
ncbi:bestrophin family ion channel [Dyadobacter soli]